MSNTVATVCSELNEHQLSATALRQQATVTVHSIRRKLHHHGKSNKWHLFSEILALRTLEFFQVSAKDFWPQHTILKPTFGHHKCRNGRRSQSRTDCIALLGCVDPAVPAAPSLGGGKHATSTTHLNQSQGGLTSAEVTITVYLLLAQTLLFVSHLSQHMTVGILSLVTKSDANYTISASRLL